MTSFRNKAGFTLIEVLVSLTIMAMITAVAFAGLSIGIDSWQRGSRKIDELDALFALERLIQRQVAIADVHMFQGNAQELDFMSTYSLANGPGDPVIVRYVADSGQFLYAEASAVEYEPDRADALMNRSLGTFSKLAFRYLGADQQGRHAWFESWTEDRGLPIAVRIEIGDDVLTIPLVNRQ